MAGVSDCAVGTGPDIIDVEDWDWCSQLLQMKRLRGDNSKQLGRSATSGR